MREKPALETMTPGRITFGAGAAMTVFLRGPLWDLGSDGRTLVWTDGDQRLGAHVDGGALSVAWL